MGILELIVNSETTSKAGLFFSGMLGIIFIALAIVTFSFSIKLLIWGRSGIVYNKLKEKNKIDRKDRASVYFWGSVILFGIGCLSLVFTFSLLGLLSER